MIKFKGKLVELPDIGSRWIPTAQLRILTEKGQYLCEMVVDTGADITLIPRSLGEFLQLSFKGEKIREIRGIGDTAIPYVMKSVGLQVDRHKFPARIGVALIEEVPLILGRLDVFDHFNIEFKQKEKITVFKKT